MSLAYRFGGEEEGFLFDAISTVAFVDHDCGVIEVRKDLREAVGQQE